MKTLISSSLLLVLITCNIYAQKTFNYSIACEISNSTVNRIYWKYEESGLTHVDSMVVSSGVYRIMVGTSTPAIITLSTDNKLIKPFTFFMPDNDLCILIGSEIHRKNETAIQNDYLRLTEVNRVKQSYFPLYYKLNQNKDSVGLKKLGLLFDSLTQVNSKRAHDFLLNNPTSILQLLAFLQYSNFVVDYTLIESEFDMLDDWAKNSYEGNSIRQKIEGAKLTRIGTTASDFTQLDMNGNSFTLSSLKGKIVLLDFWASWCGPCRKKHPELVEIYDQFKSNGFEIVSVSLDTNEKAWKSAIEKDGLPWHNTTDLKGMNNSIDIKYGINAIPSNVLLDRTGRIIERNISSQELIKFLEEL